jgi:hypothetical protein
MTTCTASANKPPRDAPPAVATLRVTRPRPVTCLPVLGGPIRASLRASLVLLGLAIATGCSRAAVPSASSTSLGQVPVFSSATELVRQVSEFYRGWETARVEIVESPPADAPPETGVSAESPVQTLVVHLRRPDCIAARDPSGQAREVISDGRAAAIGYAGSRTRIEGSLRDFERLSLDPSPLAPGGWGVMFAPALMCSHPYRAIMNGVEVIEYVGQEDVEGTPAHHLRFEQRNLKWDMWVDAGAAPLVRKLVFNRPPDTSQPVPDGYQSTVLLRGWKWNQPLSDEMFRP